MSSFRSVYYLGSGAKFIACVMFPLFGAILFGYMFSDSADLKNGLFAWQTNLTGGLLVLAGFGMWIWMIAFLLWIPLRCFVFPKLIEGVLVMTSVCEDRKGRTPIVEITVGEEKLRTHTNPDLRRILQTIPCGTHLRLTLGARNSVIRIERTP